MTNPFEFTSMAWPVDPTMPKGPPFGYLAPALRSSNDPPPNMTSGQVEAHRAGLINLNFNALLQAFTGFVMPDIPLFDQMSDWATKIPEGFQHAADQWQSLVDTITNGLGGGGDNNLLGDLAHALTSIPSGNILGIGGPSDIGSSLQELLNNFVGGLVGRPGTASFPDAFNMAQLTSQNATLGAFAWDVLGIRDNTSMSSGFLPDGRSNMRFGDYAFSSTLPTFSVTQAASAIATDRVEKDEPLGLVSWLGSITGTLTAFYINIWLINATNGDLELKHHSPNILLDVSSSMDWNFYDLAADSVLPTVAGEAYAYELVPVGSGSYNVVGRVTASDLTNHPRSQVVAMAATRNNTTSPNSPPSVVVKASVVRSHNVPMFEVASNSGSVNEHYPRTKQVNTVGAYSVTVPDWADFIDVIIVPGGGGAYQRGFFDVNAIGGGNAGQWVTQTWVRGIDYDDTVTAVTGTVGAGGSPGSAGGNTTAIVPGHTITGIGGTAGAGGGPVVGHGPGSKNYNDVLYTGGGDQNVEGANGVAPGGGGAGAGLLSFHGGGAGASGAVWIVVRAGAPPVSEGSGNIVPAGIRSSVEFGEATVQGGNLNDTQIFDVDSIILQEMVSPGVVFGVSGPAGTYMKAYGNTKAANGRPLTLSDHFRLASVTKTFTQTAVFMAIDEGLLRLEDTLDMYVSDVPEGDKITIRHMLMMRSGVYEIDLASNYRTYITIHPTFEWTVDSSLKIIRSNPSQFPPGSQYQYANSNYVLLGLCVEAVRQGRTIRDVILEDIVTPLGMTETTWPIGSDVPDPAAGTAVYNSGYLGAAGAMTSTVVDMIRWAKELRDGTLLSATSRNLRTSIFFHAGDVSVSFTGTTQQYGYGHGMVSFGRWVGHDGSYIGYDCNVMFDSNTGAVCVCLENSQTVGLVAISRILYRVGPYLYPGSMTSPTYPTALPVGVESSVKFGKAKVGNIPVAFDNASVIGTSQTSIPAFTVSPDANLVLAYVSAQTSSSLSTAGASINGLAMNKLTVLSNGSYRLLVFWIIDDTLAGSQSVTLLNLPNPSSYYANGAASYKYVNGIGIPVSSTGISSTASVTASSAPGRMVANAFMYQGKLSSYDKTERGHKDTVAFQNQGLIFGDAPGAGSVAFNEVLTSSGTWMGYAIPIFGML